MLSKKLLEYIKQGDVLKFYKSTAWKKKRRGILERDNNECQHCKAQGGFSSAHCVHHKKHLRIFPELALTDSNLISLCDPCHNKEHPEKFFEETKPKFTNEERWE